MIDVGFFPHERGMWSMDDPRGGPMPPARSAMVEAAAELSSRLSELTVVPAGQDVVAGSVAQAMSLLSAARYVVERAIVYERECGSSWADIGRVLGVTAQEAQQRYGPIVRAWNSVQQPA
jgi:hypothetical protein